jgi:hypothetical protein
MIFNKWRTSKMIRELRKTKKRLSLRNCAMTEEELLQDEKRIFEWWEKETGDPIKVADFSKVTCQK